MERKIKVLCVPSDAGGCGLHRSLIPHQKLSELHSDEFDVVIKYDVDWSDLDFVSQFDIIHFHKGTYQNLEEFHKALEFCKANNITTVMDVDDYWELGQAHPLYYSYKHSNATSIIRDNLYRSDYVTTTTPIFANKIKNFNKNVKVFVNALDENIISKIKEENNNKTGKVRVGFVMGSTHKNDMELVRGFAEKLSKDVLMEIYVEYGFSKEVTVNVTKPGKSGADEIKEMMKNFQANPPKEIGGSKVALVKDYTCLKATDGEGNVTDIDMPETSNALQFFTEDGTKISIRPSGTEPKIKFYIEVKGEMGCAKCYPNANAEAEEKVKAVRASLGI